MTGTISSAIIISLSPLRRTESTEIFICEYLYILVLGILLQICAH
jgi:hypothetical protein